MVPLGKTLRLFGVLITMNRAGGNNLGNATIVLRIKEPGGTTQVHRRWSLQPGGRAPALLTDIGKLPALSQISVRILAVSDNDSDVSGGFLTFEEDA